MKTDIERLIFEFWNPLNQALFPNGERCPEIKKHCKLYEEKKSNGNDGYILMYCKKYPNACELNPFKVNRSLQK